jgi:hypothetical protein
MKFPKNVLMKFAPGATAAKLNGAAEGLVSPPEVTYAPP